MPEILHLIDRWRSAFGAVVRRRITGIGTSNRRATVGWSRLPATCARLASRRFWQGLCLYKRIMVLNKVLIALICAIVFPAAALAQTPAWSLAAKADCCATATGDNTTLARSVLLPAPFIVPADEIETALAASILLPAPTDQKVAGMSCCDHEGMPSAATPEAGCHQKMTDAGCCEKGCEMPCGQSVPPKR